MEGRELREELDEHLEGINRNTGELSALHEYVGEIDMKLEKLIERVDALQALFLAQTPTRSVRLSVRERDVLDALLQAAEPLSSLGIGRRTGLSPDVVAQALYSMKQKGVPVLAQVLDAESFYCVEEGFLKKQRGEFVVE